MIDPATGLPMPDPTGAANPFMPTMAVPPQAMPPQIAPQIAPTGVMPMAPGAAPGGMQHLHGGNGMNPWQGAPPQGLLQMLQRVQMADPTRFAQLMAGHAASRFGITPDNLGGMQSRQDIRQGMMPQHPQVMPGQMPVNPAAPVAPAGFAATPNPVPGNMY